MRFLDSLFGRTRLPRPKAEQLFQLITVELDLQTRLGWVPAGEAALCLKPLTTLEYEATEKELLDLIRLVAKESDTKAEMQIDELRYRWFIFSDEDFEDLVGVIHIAGQELQEKGYGEQMLAALFRFERSGKDAPHYLIYSYKRGAFYPFIPLPGKKRANADELRAGSLLEGLLPCESDYSRWYPLWDAPI